MSSLSELGESYGKQNPNQSKKVPAQTRREFGTSAIAKLILGGHATVSTLALIPDAISQTTAVSSFSAPKPPIAKK